MTAVPETIGRYRIVRELGRGMMGVVYEATDTFLHRRVALKTIHPVVAAVDPERFEQRFLAEARAAARLSHPNVVVVHDAGRDPATGMLYMAQEFLEGRTVAELTEEGQPLDWREAARIALRLAEALHAVHAAGILHRDVKPANVIVLHSGEPKLMDFGIAHMPASDLTVPGQVFGTPANMSPEQALSEPLDGRSDVFSLGTVLYQLLTGRRAFPGQNVTRTLTLLIHEDPPPPSDLVPGLPPDLDAVLARALAKLRQDRYPDGRSMAEDLQDVLDGRPPRYAGSAPNRAPAPPGAAPSPEPSPLEELVLDVDLLPGSVPDAGPPAPVEVPPEPPPAPPPPGPSSQVVASLLAVVLGVSALAYLALGTRSAGRPALAPPATVTVPPAPAAAPVAVVAVPQADPPPEPSAAPASPAGRRIADPAAGRASSRPSPRAPAAPAPVAAEASPAAPAAADGYLVVQFEHGLKEGSLRVWLDEEVVVSRALEAGKGKVQLEEGSPVPSGRHRVRVQVKWGDSTKSGDLEGDFEPGQTRRLEVRLGGLFKRLSLRWR